MSQEGDRLSIAGPLAVRVGEAMLSKAHSDEALAICPPPWCEVVTSHGTASGRSR